MIDLNDLFERGGKTNHEEQWISLSDLMTSLMMIFMLLSIAYMLKTQQDTQRLKDYSEKAQQNAEKIKQVAVTYDQIKRELYNDLNHEFKDDFAAWGASMDKDLSIRFDNEYILFNRGDTQLKESFKAILESFFPRYLSIITSNKYRGAIQEIRIEGHTSSMWNDKVSPQEAYFKNMELSQARTRSTLRFIMEMPDVQGEFAWLQQFVTANGLSSSHPILNADGTENAALSQRVEFRIRTDADAQMNAILKTP